MCLLTSLLKLNKVHISGEALDRLYKQYNRRRYVSPDPLQFLYDYDDKADREIVGLVASSLAYGRVAQILKSVQKVLDITTDRPREYLLGSSPASIRKALRRFKHRFTTDEDMTDLLLGVRRVVKEYGSLNECFLAGYKKGDDTVLGALTGFVGKLACGGVHMLPDPGRGGACKRLNLFLRWMVRKDAVDPGGWNGISKRALIVPLDVHMARIGCGMGMTLRRTTDMKMALEITAFFGRMSPDDPVKYDFVFTRFGIRNDMTYEDLSKRFD